ncbi:hypothetical protein QBC46DRAFT_401172 [Diplogelasinospora grovesii]|uniref:Protein kinase domain-containing protein n=1 Tax=Diplogelasinospora grovesii TaxID=303347 RepID=A0AAN6MWG3_9PEZI|nr:hypothetical protein QBC46DRAFT_401172 [Diplogelasinospora grovesii]
MCYHDGGFYTESITWDTEYNPRSDITLYVRGKGAAFRICYVAKMLADSPPVLEQLGKSYQILHKDDPDPRYGETVEHLRRPFEELMTHLAPNPPPEYLHGYLYPPWFILEAVAESGHVQPHFNTALSRQEFVRPGDYVDSKFLQPHLSPLLDSKLNTYSSRQVQVLDHTSRLVPSRVLVDGTVYFFKPWVSGRVHGYYELQSYRKILAAAEASPPLLTDARICRLHGLIIDEDDDVLQHYHLDSDEKDYPGTRLVGLLLTYIENKGTLVDLAPWSDCKNEDRSRWSGQICESVKCLHAAGVAWGDAKPENVLVDKEGNAYLIDFGGSFTPGWVDEDKRETVEGDWQGVQRINDWLVKWSNEPVHRPERAVQER